MRFCGGGKNCCPSPGVKLGGVGLTPPQLYLRATKKQNRENFLFGAAPGWQKEYFSDIFTSADFSCIFFAFIDLLRQQGWTKTGPQGWFWSTPPQACCGQAPHDTRNHPPTPRFGKRKRGWPIIGHPNHTTVKLVGFPAGGESKPPTCFYIGPCQRVVFVFVFFFF